jgi:hypothetical protein
VTGSVFLLHRVTPTGKDPLMVAVGDGKGGLRMAAAPDSYYADVVVPAMRGRAEQATPEEADRIMQTLVDRYSSDYRMEVAHGDTAGLVRKAEVLLRKWEKRR